MLSGFYSVRGGDNEQVEKINCARNCRFRKGRLALFDCQLLFKAKRNYFFFHYFIFIFNCPGNNCPFSFFPFWVIGNNFFFSFLGNRK